MSFEAVVRAALAELPPELGAALENVAIVIERRNDDDPDLYGLFEGVPLTEGGPGPGELPNQITIYEETLLADFPDPVELQAEIRITVLHELGHSIGLDEDRLDELGYG